jgi:hypothetical protein
VASPIKTAKGFMVSNIARDITERKRAEDLIQAQNEQLHGQNAELQVQNRQLEAQGFALLQAEESLRQLNGVLEL